MRPDSSPTLHAYPALLAGTCLAAGIVLASVWRAPLWVWGILAAVGPLAVIIGERRTRRRLIHLQPLVRALGAGLMLLAAGGACHTLDLQLPSHHVAHLVHPSPSPAPVSLTGRVVKDPRATAFGTRLVLDEVVLLGTGGSAYPRAGRVQLSLSAPSWKPTPAYPAIARGDVIRVTAALQLLPERRNPADFDYGAYLRRHGIYAMLTVDRAEQVQVVGSRLGLVERITASARHGVRAKLARYVPRPEARAMLSALLLGDRSHIDDHTRTYFTETGLLHLLAISGLHVMLIGLALYHLLRPMLLRCGLTWRAAEIVRAVVTMSVLMTYLLVAGAGTSVVRAVVMAGLWIGAALVQRPVRALNTLGVAALVLLAGRPVALFEVGFQLSFAAVAALVTLPPVLTRAVPEWIRCGRWRRRVTDLMAASLAASLGTMPVLLYHFGHASFAGLVLNLAAIPLTAVTLGAGLFTLGSAGWLAGTFGALAAMSVHLLTALAEVGADLLAWAAVKDYIDSGWVLAASVLALTGLAQWARPRLRWQLVGGALLLLATGLWVDLGRGHYQPDLDVVFLDVGQGDAALVTLPNHRRLLIDTGAGSAYSDRGARTVLAHLARSGIRHLDAVVITHPHSDHLGGLPSLLRTIPVGVVFHSGEAASSGVHAEVAQLLDSLHVSDETVRAGMTLDLDSSVRIQVLSPTPRLVGLGEANEGSVVLRVQYGETVLLFTGDAEAEAERHLVARYGSLLSSDVIKVAHHGSSTSSTPAFVRQAAQGTGALAVVSVGPTNRYGLPSPAVLDGWRICGASVRTTAEEGAVWIRSDGRSVTPVLWRQGSFFPR